MHIGNRPHSPAALPAENTQRTQAKPSSASSSSTSGTSTPIDNKDQQNTEKRRRSISERDSAARKLGLDTTPAPTPPRRESTVELTIPDIVVHLAEESTEVETPAQRAAAIKAAEWKNVHKKTDSNSAPVALQQHFPFLSPHELSTVFGAAARDELRKVSSNIHYDAVRFDNHYGENVWVLSHNVRHPDFPIRAHEIIAYQAEKAGVDARNVQYMVGQNIAGPEAREILSQYGFKHMDLMPPQAFEYFTKHTAVGKSSQKMLDALNKRIVSARLLLEDEKEQIYSLVLKLEQIPRGR